jgi:hypothetical protein
MDEDGDSDDQFQMYNNVANEGVPRTSAVAIHDSNSTNSPFDMEFSPHGD